MEAAEALTQDKQHSPAFHFWEEDCRRYVTKPDHGNWHLWDELLWRLEREFGHPFRVVAYEKRGDWLRQMWFHPKDTPRSQEAWIGQAQLWFDRNIETQTITYGLMVERPGIEAIQSENMIYDRDGNRLVELLEHDVAFRQMLDDLLGHDFSFAFGVWGEEISQITSAAELRQSLKAVSEHQGWDINLGQKMPCAEAVTLGEEITERIMEAYRLVWPIFLRLMPQDVQGALGVDCRKVVAIGAAGGDREEDDQWLMPARELMARTGKVTSWWSFNPDLEYIARLRESLPTWLYVSYSGHITWRGRIVDFAGPQDKPIESPWPEYTLPEERGRSRLTIRATGTEHDIWMWFLLDRIEHLKPPLHQDDFEPIGKKYQSPGPKHFAFVYERSPGSKPIDGLQAYLSAHNFHFSPDLLATYYLSLQTKPLVILSGLSGTGKTKLAQLFAEWMGGGERAILIPVHPDWTDHRGLLGFCHLLTGTYHATDFLRLLLAARVDWMHGEKRPYFVVLDEMNLARVEHYFADFLSVLESRRQGEDGVVYQDPLSLHDQPRCLLAAGNEALAQDSYAADADHKACIVACEGCPFQDLVKKEHRRGEYTYDEAHRGHFDPLYFVPPRLEVPFNVYFTGTVNVDETTFTFSPKVLDRANVIEFWEVDLEGYWRETGQTGNLSYTCADDSIVRALTHEFTYPFTTGLRQEALQELNLAPYREQLAALVHLLEPSHMHFGYRVADEILVYLLNARCLDDPAFNLDAAFDCAVLQKILPRFHGARAHLWQPLLRLLAFCADDPAATEEQAKTWGEMSVERIREQAGPEPRLPRSTAKLLRMLSDLETEGFTSFT